MSRTRVVVIGAGLAGLVAATRLANAGLRPTVIAKGLGGLTLSPGTIDLLGYAPQVVGEVPQAIEALVAAEPAHPYRHIPLSTIADGLETLRGAIAPITIEGSDQRNMLLPTMLGGARPAAYAPATMAAGALRPDARYLIAGFAAMRDNPVALCAATLPRAAAARGITGVHAHWAVLHASPRPGEPDVSGVLFARALDDPAFLARVAAELRPHVGEAELVGMPAVLGMARSPEVVAELSARVGATVFEIPTIPPSVPGMRMDAALRGRLSQAGCRVVIGPSAVGLERNGGRVTGVLVDNGGRVTTEHADAVVFATGGLASGAIHIDSHGSVREMVADLPLSGDPGPQARFADEASGDHPGMAIGIAVDDQMRPLSEDGAPWADNLFAAGGTIAGAQPWRQLCGEGICLGSAAIAADAARQRTMGSITVGGS